MVLSLRMSVHGFAYMVLSSLTSNIYSQGNVTQTFTPWEVAKDSSGLKTNYGKTRNDRLHYNHFHFTSKN